MADLDLARGRSVVLPLTNRTGATRSPGDVVIIDTANNESFTSALASNFGGPIGVVDETIGIGSNGRVVVEGYARQVKVLATASRGDYLYHSSSALTAAHMAGSGPTAGAFGYVLKGGSGTEPSAHIFPTYAALGAAASASAGSNSMSVGATNQAGVAATFSPSDHRHLGIHTVTSSSSNTLQRPTINIRAGTNVGVTATDTDGDGTLDTITIHSSGAGGGGGGGISHTYLGYNTVGGSTETMTNSRFLAKKVTVSSAGLLASISCYIDLGASNDSVSAISALLYTDSAGTPQYLVAANMMSNDLILLDNAAGGGGNTNPRWFHIPIGAYVTAGDYWIAVGGGDVAGFRIYYDGSGSDRYYTSGGSWSADWGFYAPTTTANQYSIRASLIT